jgi:hypothetical protein
MELLHTVLLVAHIAAGGTGLLVAWPALGVRKRRGTHTVLGRIYATAAAVLCASGIGLFGYDPARLWIFVVIAAATATAVGLGIWFARHRPRGWYVWHLNLMSSSVISFVTAFLLQVSHFALWAAIVPTLVGSPLIAYRTLVAKAVIRRTGAAGWRRSAARAGSRPA